MTTSENPIAFRMAQDDIAVLLCAECSFHFYIQKKSKQGKKRIYIMTCCGAPVCDGCGEFNFERTLCQYCKRQKPLIDHPLKSNFSCWSDTFKHFQTLGKLLINQAFISQFFRYSRSCLNYRDPRSILQQYNRYVYSEILPYFLKRVMLNRVSPPGSFILRSLHDIERCQKIYSIIRTKDFNFDSVYQLQLLNSGIVMRYSRKYCHFGFILCIALRLSIDVKCINGIIRRITNKKAR